MGQIIGALVVGVGAGIVDAATGGAATPFLATALFGGLTVTGLISTVAGAGVVAGASLLLQTKREHKQEPGKIIWSSIQSIGPQSITPRYYAAGRCLLGGIQHLYECPDGLHLLIGSIINCEPIDGIDDWLCDGETISNHFVAPGTYFPYLTSSINGVVATANIGSNVVWPNAGLKWQFSYTQAVTLQFNGSGQPYFTDQSYPIGFLPTMCFEFGNGSPSGYVSQIASYFWPSYWNSTFLCKNLSCIYAMAVGGAVIVNRAATYPRFFPQISVIARGAPIFDPRAGGQTFANPSTWVWSRNAVLILVWYMTHYDGGRIPAANINWASVIAEANYADDLVPTLGLFYSTLTASGTGSVATITYRGPNTFTTGQPITVAGMLPSGYNGVFTVTAASAGSVSYACTQTGAQTQAGTVTQGSTEARFSCDVQWNMGEAVKDVMGRLSAACDCTVWEDEGGLWNFWCAKALTPTITLTDDDIASYEFQELTAALDEVNYITPSYVEPRENYQMVPGVPASDSVSIGLVGERPQTITLKEVASPDQAYRLAYRALKRQNPPLKLIIVGGISLLRAVGDVVIGISSEAVPWVNGTYRFSAKAKVSGYGERIGFELAQVGSHDYDDVIMAYDPVSPEETSVAPVILPTPIVAPDAPTLANLTISGDYYVTATATVAGSPPTDTALVYYVQITEVNGAHVPIGPTSIMPNILSEWVRQSNALLPGAIYAVSGWFIEGQTPSNLSGTSYITTPIPTPDAPTLAEVSGAMVTATAKIGGVAPPFPTLTWNAQYRIGAGAWTSITTSLSQWVLETGALTVGQTYEVNGWFSVGASNGPTSASSFVTIT
ncbi:MAG: hypothetical protein WA733_12440 [Methylocystis sp.]